MAIQGGGVGQILEIHAEVQVREQIVKNDLLILHSHRAFRTPCSDMNNDLSASNSQDSGKHVFAQDACPTNGRSNLSDKEGQDLYPGGDCVKVVGSIVIRSGRRDHH